MSLLSANLRAFYAITKTKTVHGAAKDLGITQTGVTQRIRALEQILQATLFIRTRKGMLPTPEGEALLLYCQASLELEGEALAKITGGGAKETVRINLFGPSSIMRTRVVPSCIPVLKKFSKLTVSFQLDDQENLDESLKMGKAQIAVLARNRVAREMDSKVLKPERYVLVGPRPWGKRPLAEILEQEKIIDFDDSDAMTFSYLKKFHLLQRVNPNRHFVNNTESLVEMIQCGLGYGVLTEEFAKSYLRSEKIVLLNSGNVFENSLAIAWYPRHQMPAYFKALVEAIH